MKIVYIAHPIAGNVEANIEKVEKIVAHVHQKRGVAFPIAPYLDACRNLNDSNERDRKAAMTVNKKYFKHGIIDELWICSQRISPGMWDEIQYAIENRISIIFKDFEKEIG